jgi:hypothetical protein
MDPTALFNCLEKIRYKYIDLWGEKVGPQILMDIVILDSLFWEWTKKTGEKKKEFSFYTPNPYSFISPVYFQAIPVFFFPLWKDQVL